MKFRESLFPDIGTSEKASQFCLETALALQIRFGQDRAIAARAFTKKCDAKTCLTKEREARSSIFSDLPDFLEIVYPVVFRWDLKPGKISMHIGGCTMASWSGGILDWWTLASRTLVMLQNIPNCRL